MSEIKVKTGKDESARVVTVQYDIPADLNGLTNKLGAELTHAFAARALTLAVQALVRQKVAAGADDAAAQTAVDAWVPGTRAPSSKKSPLERAQAALGNMSKEDLDALMAKIKEAKRVA